MAANFKDLIIVKVQDKSNKNEEHFCLKNTTLNTTLKNTTLMKVVKKQYLKIMTEK